MVTFPDVLRDPLPPCPACGAYDWRDKGQVKDYGVTGEWFELKECGSCHLQTTYPHPKEAEIGRYYASKNYISHSDTREGLVNKLYHLARTQMLKKKYKWVTIASGKTQGLLLDVGAGTGHFAYYMQTRGWQVEALEPDESARKVALEKLKINIQPLENLGKLQPHTYDVITLWHVLEHVHDLSGYMDHFRLILRPGGVLLIAVPNHTSRDAKQYGPKWAAYDVPRHLWHFSPEAMNYLLNRHQFKLEKKIPMHLDAFYVSMLSEKYEGNNSLGSVAAFFSGLRTLIATKQNINRASSIIYVAK